MTLVIMLKGYFLTKMDLEKFKSLVGAEQFL